MNRLYGIVLAIGLTPLCAGADETTVSNFTLADHRGKEWSLGDFSEQKLVVLAVTGTECPLAQKYLPRLQQLAMEFSERGVAFVGINANPQDSLAEIGAQVRGANLEFPMLKDTRQTVVAELGAKRTPEVFVLDAQRVVRYRGRIDDQHAVGNRSKTNPMQQDLRIALEELLEGKPVTTPRTDAIGCLITRTPTPKAEAKVTYGDQISRLLQKHCVECHRPGEIAPFSLTDYEEAAGWAEMMVEVTQTGQMPPWHASPDHGTFRNARGLSAEEKQLLVDWAKAGAPAGDLNNVPPLPQFTAGWQLPREPDLVVPMRDTPFDVPAEGVVRYQYFVVDPNFTEDKWVTSAEVIPGNRAVVHHIIVFAVPDGHRPDGENDSVTAFVPGLRIDSYPAGYAKRIPAGAKLFFQIHYTPNGSPQQDLSKLGLVFADEADVTHAVFTQNVKNTRLHIEPQKDDQRFEARPVTTPVDTELLDLMPHMHLRGKSFRFDITDPTGDRRVLLDVPRYDFNWQTVYIPDRPIPIAKGSTFYAEAVYDNSAHNLANPNPGQTVTWGEQTWDEMLIGYFNYAVPRGSDTEKEIIAARAAEQAQQQVRQVIRMFDRNKNGTIEQNEVTAAQKPIFDRIDADSDGVVTPDEVTAKLPELRALFKR